MLLECLELLRTCSLQDERRRNWSETASQSECGPRRKVRTKTKVLETAAGEHTGTARAATGTGTSATLLLRLLDINGLGLGLRVVALLRLTTVCLLRRRGVVTLLRLAVAWLATVTALLRVACLVIDQSRTVASVDDS